VVLGRRLVRRYIAVRRHAEPMARRNQGHGFGLRDYCVEASVQPGQSSGGHCGQIAIAEADFAQAYLIGIRNRRSGPSLVSCRLTAAIGRT